MKNKKIQQIMEHLFPHEHSKFLLGSIVAAFILFGFFGIFRFQNELSNIVNSELKAQIFDIYSNSSFKIDIVDNAYVVDGFLEIPISIQGNIPTATPITSMQIGLSGIPSFFSTIEARMATTFDGETGLGQAEMIPTSREFPINLTELNLHGNNADLTEYMIIKLAVNGTPVVSTITFDYIMIVGGAGGQATFDTNRYMVNINPNPPMQAPNDPTISSTASTVNSIIMDWTSGGGDSTDGYRMYINNGNGQTAVSVATVGASTFSYEFSNLSPLTEYIVGVSAYNAAGSTGVVSTTETTQESFTITGVTFSGDGPANTNNEFYGQSGNTVTATVAVGSTGTYQYSYEWTCAQQTNSAVCPGINGVLNTPYQNSKSATLEVVDNSWDDTTWDVNVSVKDTVTNETDSAGPFSFSLVNKAPTLTLASVVPNSIGTIAQGTTIGSTFYVEQDGSLTITFDIDDDDDPNYYTVTPDSNSLSTISINNSQVLVTVNPLANNEVTVDDTGAIIDNRSPKNIAFTLKDGDLGELKMDITLHVVNKNDAPTITTSTSSPISFSVDSPQVRSIVAEDIDTIHGDSLTYSVSGLDQELVVAGFAIDSSGELGWATDRPSHEDVGVFDATVQVSDQSGLTDSKAFQISVTANNRDPEITVGGITAYSGAEDTEIVVSLINRAWDPDGDTITWSVEGGTVPALNPDLITSFNVDNTSGSEKVTFTPNGDDFGIAEAVILRASDTNGGYVDQSISLEWTSVNDPVTFTEPLANILTNYVVRNEDEVISLPLTVGMVSDPDDPNNSAFGDLVWSVPLTNPAFAISSVSITETTINFVPTENANGIVTVTINVSDGESVASDTVALKWASLIDSPTWSSWPGKDGITATANAGQTYKFNMTQSVDDPDLDSYAYNRDTINNSTHTRGQIDFVVPNGTTKSGSNDEYWFNWTPDTSDKGFERYFSVTAKDPYDDTLSVTQEFTIYVPVEEVVYDMDIVGITATSSTAIEATFNYPIQASSINVNNIAINRLDGSSGLSATSAFIGSSSSKLFVETAGQTSVSYTLEVVNLISADGLHATSSTGASGEFMGMVGANSLGDCNGDGNKMMNDAIMILKYLVGLNQDYISTITSNCDLTGSVVGSTPDNNITTLDAIETYKIQKAYNSSN